MGTILDSIANNIGVKNKQKLADGTYLNNKYGCSIRCPNGWRIINSQLPLEMLVQFSDPMGGGINLMAGPTYVTQESIEDLENLAIRNVHRFRGEMESLKRIKVDDIEAIEAIYSGALGLKTKKVGFVKDGDEFIITCSTTPNLFTKYEPIFDECIQTFKFKK